MVDVGTVEVVVADLEVELFEPRNAPSVDNTTTMATAPATS